MTWAALLMRYGYITGYATEDKKWGVDHRDTFNIQYYSYTNNWRLKRGKSSAVDKIIVWSSLDRVTETYSAHLTLKLTPYK